MAAQPTPTMQELASRLPDLPRWVETRDKLLSGRCKLFGLAEDRSMNFVVRAEEPLVCVVGKPARTDVEASLKGCKPEVDVLAIPENCDHVAAALKTWHRKKAFLHLLANPAEPIALQNIAVRFMQKADLTDLPAEFHLLRSELDYALTYSRAAAAFEEDQPVSFCYVGSETESLWDISIETLPAFQRKGYAQACVQFLIDFMSKRGKQPVWCAEEWNLPSRNLAKKMGFEVVDHLFVFSQNKQTE